MKKLKKLKMLPPTLREKKRYIMFEVLSEEEVNYEELESAIWNILLDFLGEFGVATTSFWILKERWKGNRGIIRCNHTSVQHIIASLGLLERIGDTRLTIRILGVSGTIKSLIEKTSQQGQEKN